AGLARFGAAVGDAAIVKDAADAFAVVDASHATKDGGYTHEAAGKDAVVHLADVVAMGNAAIELYDATGDAQYREKAHSIAKPLLGFAAKDGALLEHKADAGVFDLDARKPIRANAEAARLLLKVGRLDDDAALRDGANAILNAFSSEPVVTEEGR